MALEDEGKFREAELQFIKAKKPKEAVLMYVHNQDWDSAQRVAEEHDEDSVSDVLVGQAKVAFEARDYAKFESLLLRAQRPELAVKQYKDQGLWPEALRVCKEYLPHRLKGLQDEYDRSANAASSLGGRAVGGNSLDGLVGQARQWEEAGEYQRAIETYLKVDNTNTKDPGQLAAAWTRAGELAIKFLETDKAEDVATVVGPRLVALGRYSGAAQLYLGVEMVREAIDAFIDGEEWAKAKKVAKELEPRLEGYVDEKYKTFLRSEGKAEQLASVDLISALDMYVEQGNWNKAISTAANHGPEVLHKYVAIYASQLIKVKYLQSSPFLYSQNRFVAAVNRTCFSPPLPTPLVV
jgi:intraflagellar transport protein 172